MFESVGERVQEGSAGQGTVVALRGVEAAEAVMGSLGLGGDLGPLPDGAVEEGLEELERALGRLEVERLRLVAEVDRRRAWHVGGYSSMQAWLVHRLGLGRGAADRTLRRARALRRMPVVRRALGEGRISRSAMEVLVAAREGHEDAFAAAEDDLVDAARSQTVGRLYRTTRYWRFVAAAAEGWDEAEAVRAERFLHLSRTLFGMVRLDGELDPETGEAVLAAVGAAVDAGARSGGQDRRTPSQRRADALGEVCRQWLDGSDRPTVAGERPHLTLTAHVSALEGSGAAAGGEAPHGTTAGAGRQDVGAEFGSGEPALPEVIRRIACDASVARVLLRGRSEPLDVGRRTAVVPGALRRAVVARDGGCRFPGCDRPQSWCDAHHVIHWADGGSTALDNLVLLCRPHHRMLHGRRGFSVVMERGHPVFRGPDGVLAEDRGPS